MLELPESYTISKQMEQNLEGQTIVGAEYHGGMVQINTDEWMITFADGAYPRYFDEPRRFPKKHQLAIYFDDETAIFVSIQMYGIFYIFPKGTCQDEYYVSASTKPDPLSKDFTYEYFRSLYTQSKKKLSAKAFLATQQRIPGLGNGVLQDILWDAGLDPRLDMKALQEEEFETLYHSVRKILKQMCDGGGRDTEKDLFGQKGRYVTQLSKNSLHEPCMKCGYEIHKAAYMGGTVYFCEHCQRR